MKSEKLIFGLNPSNAIYYDCFGCSSQLVIKYESWDGYIADTVEQNVVARGWQKRNFHPRVNPWFCSTDCAYSSKAAIYCQEYWLKEVQAQEAEDSIFAKIKGWFR